MTIDKITILPELSQQEGDIMLTGCPFETVELTNPVHREFVSAKVIEIAELCGWAIITRHEAAIIELTLEVVNRKASKILGIPKDEVVTFVPEPKHREVPEVEYDGRVPLDTRLDMVFNLVDPIVEILMNEGKLTTVGDLLKTESWELHTLRGIGYTRMRDIRLSAKDWGHPIPQSWKNNASFPPQDELKPGDWEDDDKILLSSLSIFPSTALKEMAGWGWTMVGHVRWRHRKELLRFRGIGEGRLKWFKEFIESRGLTVNPTW